MVSKSRKAALIITRELRTDHETVPMRKDTRIQYLSISVSFYFWFNPAYDANVALYEQLMTQYVGHTYEPHEYVEFSFLSVRFCSSIANYVVVRCLPGQQCSTTNPNLADSSSGTKLVHFDFLQMSTLKQ